jgi:hypothetical protein
MLMHLISPHGMAVSEYQCRCMIDASAHVSTTNHHAHRDEAPERLLSLPHPPAITISLLLILKRQGLEFNTRT